MGNALFKGGVLGAIVLFAWGFVAHTVLPWYASSENFTNEDAVSQVLSANAPTSGVYFVPGWKPAEGLTAEQKKAWMEAQKQKAMRGPAAFVAFRRETFDSMARPLIIQYLICLVGNLLVTALVLRTRGLTFAGRVGFVVMAGLAAAVLIHLPNWNWYGFSTSYTLFQVFEIVVGSLLSGIVIAWATKPVGAP
jgi:hypothetical protein